MHSQNRSTSTIRHFCERWFPKLMTRRNHQTWTAAGGPTLDDWANKRVCQILRDHPPTPPPPELVAELDDMEKHCWKTVS
jgi:trimethylamine:corrinoid methyltransferase-like protein